MFYYQITIKIKAALTKFKQNRIQNYNKISNGFIVLCKTFRIQACNINKNLLFRHQIQEAKSANEGADFFKIFCFLFCVYSMAKILVDSRRISLSDFFKTLMLVVCIRSFLFMWTVGFIFLFMFLIETVFKLTFFETILYHLNECIDYVTTS